MAELIRLNKYLAGAGVCSRRQADEHILAGRVKVNGQIAKIGTSIDSLKDRVEVDGQNIDRQPNYVYYALYKPKGVVSTASDERGRKTVVDLVPKSPRVYPVGRLDADSEGLIILTNDGELTQQLTHPSFKHQKEYIVKCKHQTSNIKMTTQTAKIIIQKFQQGLMIDGKFMKVDMADIPMFHDSSFTLRPVLHTGYNRQIRRMCDKIGLDVVELKRVRMANLRLSNLDLKPGEFKRITKKDIIS